MIYHFSRLGLVPCYQARCHYPASLLFTVGPSGLQYPQGELELELRGIFTLSVTLKLQADVITGNVIRVQYVGQ